MWVDEAEAAARVTPALTGPMFERAMTRLSFWSSAALFFAWGVLEQRIGSPPSSGTAILDWLRAQKTLLAFVSETLFFAAMLLVPASFGLYRWLRRTHAWAAICGAGAVFVAIPVLLVSLVAHGRLVYPIFDMKAHTPDVAQLILAFYYGGLHAFFLILAGVAVVVSLATRKTDRAFSIFGFVTAASDVMAAYPDALGPNLTFAARLPFAAWLVVVGLVASPHGPTTTSGLASRRRRNCIGADVTASRRSCA